MVLPWLYRQVLDVKAAADSWHPNLVDDLELSNLEVMMDCGEAAARILQREVIIALLSSSLEREALPSVDRMTMYSAADRSSKRAAGHADPGTPTSHPMNCRDGVPHRSQITFRIA